MIFSKRKENRKKVFWPLLAVQKPLRALLIKIKKMQTTYNPPYTVTLLNIKHYLAHHIENAIPIHPIVYLF